MANERVQDQVTYKKRINAWAMYDWANSAFATTILASLLPIYYSTVAGSTLPSEATATAYWSLTISFSLFALAILSPILGTISDVMRNKKRFLAIFIGGGVLGTGLLIFVGTGDWLLASLFLVLGRIGFGGSIVFYDALLPHVARKEDRDWVSTRGYALGYLGGGILLAINVAMFLFIPDSLFENAGIRLSFLSVAIWWLVFSLPIMRHVPEPPAVTDCTQARPKRCWVSASADFARPSAISSAIASYSSIWSPSLSTTTPSAPLSQWRPSTAPSLVSDSKSWYWRFCWCNSPAFLSASSSAACLPTTMIARPSIWLSS